MLVSGGDEAPWIPAGLAASVVLLVALSAREVVMRRAWTRYLLEQGIQEHSSRGNTEKRGSSRKTHSTSLLSAALQTIQKQSVEADSAGSTAESHLDVFHLCQDYLATTDEALQANSLPTEKRIAIRAGQERVRALQKHHLLTWARDSSRSFTHEAQQRARISDKIETANRALHSLDSALRVYPDEPELSSIVDRYPNTNAKNRAYSASIQSRVTPMPGLYELVEKCKIAGLAMAVASSSVLDDVRAIVQALRLEGAFSALVSGNDVSRGKPDPEIFLETARRMNVEPRDCVVLEDTAHGVQAARRAGMLCVAVPNNFTEDHDFSQADMIVKSLAEFDLAALEAL